MNTLDAIFTRASVRSYTGTLDKDKLDTIIRAGKAAPIGLKRYDTVHFTVITDKSVLSAINDAALETMGRGRGSVLYNAPCLVLVSVDLSAFADPNVSYSNAACTIENMALAAAELGVGSCHIWGAVRVLVNCPHILSRLPIPKGFTPVCSIVLGDTEESLSVHEPREISTDYI